MTSQLFSPFDLGNLKLSNRIVIAPMCQYSAANGQASNWHLIHLGQLAISGAALMFLEATAVLPEGRISPDDLGLWSDETEAALARVIREVRCYSSMPIGIQLSHAGRKASTSAPWLGGKSLDAAHGGWQIEAPSPIAFSDTGNNPSMLDHEKMQSIKQAFVRSAQRAQNLGLNAIQLHVAHGYLLHQFLSPLSNHRGDQYGGTLENRMRFPLEVFEVVRAAVGTNLTLGVRLSATDWVEGGWDLKQSVVFCNALKQLGCDFIDVSSGGLSPLQKIPLKPGYQVLFADRIRRETDMPTITVGLITDPDHAESIIAAGQADMVALARGMLYNPRWPWHAAAKLGAQVNAPNQYLRSQPHDVKDLFKQN